MNKQMSFPKLAVIAGCLVMLFFFGGCISGKQKMLDAGMKPLNDQDLQSLFSTPLEVSYYSSKNGRTSSVTYSPDGSQTITNSKISDEGTWRIENGEQCSKWKTIRKGAESCNTFFKVSENKYDVFDEGGTKLGEFTVK